MIYIEKNEATDLFIPRGASITCDCEGGGCAGYDKGYEDGYAAGYEEGYESGYTEGYAAGQRGCGDLPYVTATYNVTTTTEPTKLYEHQSSAPICYSRMILEDGTILEAASAYTFSATGLHNVYFVPKSDELAYSNFQNIPTLVEVVIPNFITRLRIYIRSCPNLTAVSLSNFITTLRDGCFGGDTSLVSLNIPSGITSFGNSCFHDCSALTSIEIPTGLTEVGSSCFYGCSKLEGGITLPDSVTVIPDFCFDFCNSLTSITLGNNVTSIGGFVFPGGSTVPGLARASKLERIIINTVTPPTANTNAFAQFNVRVDWPLPYVYVPDESVEAYKTAWVNLTNLYPSERIKPISELPEE